MLRHSDRSALCRGLSTGNRDISSRADARSWRIRPSFALSKRTSGQGLPFASPAHRAIDSTPPYSHAPAFMQPPSRCSRNVTFPLRAQATSVLVSFPLSRLTSAASFLPGEWGETKRSLIADLSWATMDSYIAVMIAVSTCSLRRRRVYPRP